MKIRISDYIAQTVSKFAKNCYMVTGGGAMHLNDAFSRTQMNIIFCHHEQACSIAAEAEARLTNKPAVVNVTTGPGGINAINGVFGAFVDSISMIVISGQVKRETLVEYRQGSWRQLGDQEVNIVEMVKKITKYAVCILDPLEIRYHLEKAIFESTNGRPGPVWIDVPIDIQAMQVEIDELKGFEIPSQPLFNNEIALQQFKELNSILQNAKKPVIYVGAGIHISSTVNLLKKFTELLEIPVVTSFNSNDIIENDFLYYVGRGGTIGNRSGNFVLQSADVILVLGSRLNIRQVSYNWNSFAPNAIKIGIDIDINELNKPTCIFNIKIHSSLQYFFQEIFTIIKNSKVIKHTLWSKWGREKLFEYPVCLKEYWENNETINPYCFVDTLFKFLNDNEVVVCADGTACVVTFQGMHVKKGQRVFHNSGCASMGYDLPASIGAFNANKNIERIICIAGDGSIMLNLQELQTISGNDYPIQIFILNNKGYHSIRQTQRSFFSDNIVGCGTDSGLTFPEFKKIASAFDFPYFRISNHRELIENMQSILDTKGRFICEVDLDLEQHFSPKLSSKKLDDGSMVTSSLEDMWPFLPTEELKNNIKN